MMAVIRVKTGRAFHPQIRFAVDNDTIALHKRRGGCGELSETVDLQRNVLIIIAQRDVGTALTSGIDLRDLPGPPKPMATVQRPYGISR